MLCTAPVGTMLPGEGSVGRAISSEKLKGDSEFCVLGEM